MRSIQNLNTIDQRSFGTDRHGVLTTFTLDEVAFAGGVVLVIVKGENAALIEVAVLDDLVDGEVLAELGDGQQFRGLGLDLLSGDTADVVPGLALTAGASLLIPHFNI